jgi:predicted PurR-regulated permease PerM
MRRRRSMAAERSNALVTWLILAACAVILAPLLPVMMLAVWFGAFGRVLHRPLMRVLRGRRRLAAALTVIALVAILIPIVVVLSSLAVEAYNLVVELMKSPRGKELLEQLVRHRGNGSTETGENLWQLAAGREERAWGILQQLAGTATRVAIGLFVLVTGMYAVIVDGAAWWRWIECHSPISQGLLRRLHDAFFETGRGLFIGIGGSGLIQAVVATIAYLALSVPHALELGMLTFCASVIPGPGTAIVWAPIAAGLALTGHVPSAIVLTAIGLAVIGTVDNLARPILARRGKLQLPAWVVIVSMFAGLQVVGAWGLFIGPLAVRFAKAALESRQPGTTSSDLPGGAP